MKNKIYLLIVECNTDGESSFNVTPYATKAAAKKDFIKLVELAKKESFIARHQKEELDNYTLDSEYFNAELLDDQWNKISIYIQTKQIIY